MNKTGGWEKCCKWQTNDHNLQPQPDNEIRLNFFHHQSNYFDKNAQYTYERYIQAIAAENQILSKYVFMHEHINNLLTLAHHIFYELPDLNTDKTKVDDLFDVD